MSDIPVCCFTDLGQYKVTVFDLPNTYLKITNFDNNLIGNELPELE
jgi:hypothetical protein